MAYHATVCRVRTRPHPNADRLQLGDCNGYQVIVGKDVADGTMGVFFPEGGQLSHAFCMATGLYRKHPETGEPMGGMFEEHRRVKAVRLRGEISEGFWCPVEQVAKLDPKGERHGFCEGATMMDFCGVELCRKYVTPATQRAMTMLSKSSGKRQTIDLPRHYDTPQLRDMWRTLKPGYRLVWTEKLHGTSARTGRVLAEQPQWWITRMWNRAVPWLAINPSKKWQDVSGTRNCILAPQATGEKGKDYRQIWHDRIAPMLNAGEVVFYELVGYEGEARPIMAPHHDEKMGRIVYEYGCAPGTNAAYVYRITQNDRDLTWSEVQARAEVLGLPTVPTLHVQEYAEGDDLVDTANKLTRGPSTLGCPLREGVCLRAEEPTATDWRVHKSLKHKGFKFCELEGIRKNDEDYVDAEEAA